MGATQHLTCDGILFDLDGVLVDSLPLIEDILRDWARTRGIDADQAVAAAHGRRDIDMVAHVAPHLDAEAEARWILDREETTFTGLAPASGAHRLLASLPAHRWAVVTSGGRGVARGRLA